MAIEVKHGANPSAMLYARYGAADGKAWREALGQFLKSRERQQMQSREHDFRREMSDRSHQQQIDKQMLGQDFKRGILAEDYRRDLTRQGLRQNFQLNQQRLAGNQRRQLYADEYARDQAAYKYKLTAEQKADENKLRQALYAIENDPAFSDEDKMEARRRIVARMADIDPLPMREDPPQYPEGRGEGEYWYDDKMKAYLTRDAKNNIKVISEEGSGKSGGISSGEAMKIAIEKSIDIETGAVNRKQAEELYQWMMGMSGGGQQVTGQETGPADFNDLMQMQEPQYGSALPAPQEPAMADEVVPATQKDKSPQKDPAQISAYRSLTEVPADLKQQLDEYGIVYKVKPAKEINNIPEIKANIEAFEYDIEQMDNKYKTMQKKSGVSPGSPEAYALSGDLGKIRNRKKSVKKKIAQYKKRLKELQKKEAELRPYIQAYDDIQDIAESFAR
jgi:hypothetical protein